MNSIKLESCGKCPFVIISINLASINSIIPLNFANFSVEIAITKPTKTKPIQTFSKFAA